MGGKEVAGEAVEVREKREWYERNWRRCHAMMMLRWETGRWGAGEAWPGAGRWAW